MVWSVGSVKGGRDAMQGRLGAARREQPGCHVQVADMMVMEVRRRLVALLVAWLMPLLVVRKALMVSEVALSVRGPVAMPMLCLKGGAMIERWRHHMVHLDQMCHCII